MTKLLFGVWLRRLTMSPSARIYLSECESLNWNSDVRVTHGKITPGERGMSKIIMTVCNKHAISNGCFEDREQFCNHLKSAVVCKVTLVQ